MARRLMPQPLHVCALALGLALGAWSRRGGEGGAEREERGETRGIVSKMAFVENYACVNGDGSIG